MEIKKSEKIYFHKFEKVAIADITLIYNHFKSPRVYFYDKNDKECNLPYYMSKTQIFIDNREYDDHYAIIEDYSTYPIYSARISYEVKIQARNIKDFKDHIADLDLEYYIPDSIGIDTEPKIDKL